MKPTLRSTLTALLAVAGIARFAPQAQAQAPAGCQPAYLTNAAAAAGGLTAEYYRGSFRDAGANRAAGDATTGLPFFRRLPDLRRTDPTVSFGTVTALNAQPPAAAGLNVSARYRGSVFLLAGTYVFQTNSDDGTYLWVGPDALTPAPVVTTATSPGAAVNAANGSLFVNNDGGHGPRDASGTFVAAADGLYDIQLLYEQAGGGGNVVLSYARTVVPAGGTGGTFANAVIPQSALCPGPAALNAAPTVSAGSSQNLGKGSPTAVVLAPTPAAADADGSVAFVQILTLPAAAAGTLQATIGGATVAVLAGQGLTPAEAATLRFAPVAGFAGSSASFDFTATDNRGRTAGAGAYATLAGAGGGATYTINLVAGTNPVANADAASTASGAAVTFDLTGNDTFAAPATGLNLATVDLVPGTAAIDNTVAVAGGTFTTVGAPAGSVTFVPVAGFAGTATAPYSVQDSQGLPSNAATMAVTVAAVCQPAYLSNGGAANGLTAEYYAGNAQDFAGTAVGRVPFYNRVPGLRRADAQLDFPTNGSYGAIVPPAANSVAQPDQFSARYRGSLYLAAGSYTFQLFADDLAYVWLGPAALTPSPDPAQALFVQGNYSGATSRANFTAATSGLYDLQLLFAEGGGGNELYLRYAPGLNQTTGFVALPPGLLCAGPATANAAPTATAATNAPFAGTNAATTLSPGLSGTDPDGSIAFFNVISLPAGGVLALGGVPVVAGQALTPAQAAALTFAPNGTASGNVRLVFSVTDERGRTSDAAAYAPPAGATGTAYLIPIQNTPPTVTNLTNVRVANTGPAAALSPGLSATDTDGTIASFGVNGPASSGTLFFNGVAVTGPIAVPFADRGLLTYQAAAGFVGNATFTFSALDNLGASSGTATYTVPVSSGADLAVTLRAVTGPGGAQITTSPQGGLTFFEATVTNNGPLDAANVAVRIQLPAGLTGISLSNSGTYDPATGLATFPALAVTAGTTITRNIAFSMPGATANATATAPSSTADPVSANNTGTAFVSPTQVADVVVALSGPVRVLTNQLVLYTVIPTNLGPSTATGITPRAVLPAGIANVVVSNGGVYNAATGLVTWGTIAALANGASVAYTVRFTGSSAPGPILNGGGAVSAVASATSTTADGDPVAGNNDGSNGAAQITTQVVTTAATLLCIAPSTTDVTLANGNVNTYYPGLGTAAAGATTLNVGPAAAAGSAAPLAPGDLVLLMQMQGADLDASQSPAYGDGLSGDVVGSGNLLNANFTAGTYEYALVSAYDAGTGALALAQPLGFGYANADATASGGQRRYQVLRVPLYRNVDLGANLSAPRWDGRTGGVLVMDINGTLNFNGFRLDMAGRGFRGGAGQQYFGAGGVLASDYRHSSALATSANKGEGTAGTPRYLYDVDYFAAYRANVRDNNSAVLDTRSTTNPTRAALLPPALADGYPNGDRARGAPGNAGGGGVDGRPANNDQNSGGGGGANAGRGGVGGNAWDSNAATGGFGGADFTQATASRVIMGGGGGAGTTNNGTVVNPATYPANAGVPADGFASSGAAGGGLVLIRAANVGPSAGTIDVSGATAAFVADNDGSGGGGAGGTVLLLCGASNGNPASPVLQNLTLLANGGQGGSNLGAGVPHGPGGGGAGGLAFVSSGVNAASSLVPGANGTTSGFAQYGSGVGAAALGQLQTGLTRGDVPNVVGACPADVVTTLSASTPSAAPGSPVTLTITTVNNGPGVAINVLQTVQLAPNQPIASVQINGQNPSGVSGTTATYPGGATYNAATGLVTFPNVPLLAVGSLPATNVLTNTITLVMPTQTLTGTAASASTGDLDPQLTNNNGSLAPANVTVVAINALAGRVFDDVNYGGGSGRGFGAANASATAAGFATGAIGSGGTRVELYRADNSFYGATTTGPDGSYGFAQVPTGSYRVRVLNNTVRAVRNPTATGLVPVQTFRRTTSGGTLADDASRVGGENPAGADGPANGGTGSVALAFTGLNTGNQDVTAFLDQIEIVDAATGTVIATGGPANTGFEAPALAPNTEAYNPAGATWAFTPLGSGGGTNGSGIANGNALGAPLAPQGSQVGFVRSNSVISQTFVLPSGTYLVRFRAAQRNLAGSTNDQAVRVSVNGADLGDVTPAGAFAAFTTSSFTVGGGAALGALAPQSVADVAVGGTAVGGVDFGFNFDAIVNTNDAGQGSLRQFILNANALPNGLMNQDANTAGGSDPAAGIETSIFMVPNGTARPGLLASGAGGPANQLSASGVAVITPASALPGLTDRRTTIDGNLQTLNVGNGNAAALGAGGPVGTGPDGIIGTGDEGTLPTLNGPEVQITGTQGQAGSDIGLSLENTDQVVRGLSVLGFGNSGGTGAGNLAGADVRVSGAAISGILVTGNVLGASATAFGDPGTGARSTGHGILLNAFAAGATVSAQLTNNLVGFHGASGIENLAPATPTSLNIQGNEIRGNARLSLAADGVRMGAAGGQVVGNLVVANGGSGIDLAGTNGAVTATGNTLQANGTGGTETAGLRAFGQGNTVGLNVVLGNAGDGLLVRPGTNTPNLAGSTVLTRNAVFNNGQLGINLLTALPAAPDNESTGAPATGTNRVSLNDLSDFDGRKDGSSAIGGNGLLNYPVLETATIVGPNLVVTGFARPGVRLELFNTALASPAAVADASSFGEGPLFLGTVTEGGAIGGANGNVAADTNAGTGTYGPGPVNGIAQGTDNTNRFTFSIPVGTGAGQVNVAFGAVLTATATRVADGITSEYSGVVTVQNAADVTTLLAGPTAVGAGQATAPFTASFSNNGPGQAVGVTQAVALPTGSGLTPAQQAAIVAAYPGTTVTTLGSGAAASITLNFPTAATLAPGASNVFAFAFTAPAATGAVSIGSAVGAAGSQGINAAPDAASFFLTVAPVANVAATISPQAASAAAGSPARFNVNFSNAGPSAAAGVTATVQLPAGLAGLLVEGQAGTAGAGGIVTYPNPTGPVTYDPATGLLTYTGLTALASGQTVSTFLTYPQPATSPAVTAVAAIGTSTSQGAGGTSDDAQAATILTTSATDLTVALSGPATATQGGQSAYTVTTSNVGLSTQPAATTVVNIGPGRSNVFVSDGGIYDAASGLVTFPAVPLVSGQGITRSISFSQPTAGASVTVSATAGPLAGDPTPANNAASLTTALAAPASPGAANLQVLLSGPATVAPGGTATYTVRQTNNGPATATGVATTLALQPGLSGLLVNGAAPSGTSRPGGTFATYPDGSTYDSLTGLVTFAAIASQAPLAGSFITNTVSFAAPATGIVTATAGVTGTSPDPVPGDNQAQVQTTVSAPATGTDLAAAITGPATAAAGQRVGYTLTMTNVGGSLATAAVQTAQLPAGLSLALSGPGTVQVNGQNPTSATATTATYADGSTYDATTGLLTLPTAATLAPGAGVSATVSFVLPQQGNGSAAATLAVPTSVRSATTDPVPANNAARALTVVQPLADVSIALSGPATGVQGGPLTYFLTTANNGPAPAAAVQPTVQLPAGLGAANVTVRDANGNVLPGAYNNASGLVSFPAIGNLAVGGSVGGSVTFLAPGNTFVILPTAQATVSGAAIDANLSNNASTVATALTAPVVRAAPDVQVLVSANQTTQTAGLPVTFTVTTQNNTPGTPAANVATAVQLPAGLGGVSVSGGGTYDPATGVVTFPAVGSLSNGTPTVNTITLNAPGTGPLTAVAASGGASGPTAPIDPVPANNVASASVTVTPSADVRVTLGGPASAAAGAPVTYTAVTGNNGPSPAASVAPRAAIPTGLPLAGPNAVRVNGQLPASTSGTTATYPDGSTYDAATGAVSFPVQTLLAVGQTLTNTVSFAAPATGFVVGATATSPTPDPVPGNQAASQPTAVPAANAAPVAQAVVNSLQAPEGNTANVPLPILPLVGTDADGTVASYTIAALPPASQGTLFVFNGTTNVPLNATNFPGLVLTPAQANSLRFDPVSGFVGNVFFTYLATDNLGAASAPALYTIPVGQDNNSAYTATPPKGGTANPYANGNVLAYLIDPNGAQYSAAGLVYNATTGQAVGGASNGLPATGTNAALAPSGSGPASNPTNALPPGVSLDPTTGQVFVSNAGLLPRVGTATTYVVNVITTDIYGGTNVALATFVLGAYPLPVELLSFEAKARDRDARLTWRTASERNNDHWDVERSPNGRDFAKFAEVTGQGSKQTPTDYALTDANAQRLGATLYYRLRQVDADGTAAYSPVQAVTFGKAAAPAIALYPNPAQATTTLDLGALPPGSYAVSLTDLAGRLVRNLTLDAGTLNQLALSDLATGTYLVQVQGTATNAGLRLTKRLTKE